MVQVKISEKAYGVVVHNATSDIKISVKKSLFYTDGNVSV